MSLLHQKQMQLELQQRLDPELASAVGMFPPFHLNDIHQTREYMQAALEFLNDPEAAGRLSVTIRDVNIDVGQPVRKLRLRTYRTTDHGGKLPLILYLHGGGMVLSSPEGEDVQCIDYASTVNCMVVSVDYRLAPEHPYPAALDDCYEALCWLAENADSMGIDGNRIAVMGASAGGGLTAALAMMARDRGGPKICVQLPLYPMLDHRNQPASEFEITDNRLWNREINQQAWSMYLGGMKAQEIPVYASPASARDFTDLPRCYFFVGELDIFLDEAMSYARRLLHAGVATEFIVYPGCFHGFEALVPDASVSRRARAGIIDVLRRELHADLSGM